MDQVKVINKEDKYIIDKLQMLEDQQEYYAKLSHEGEQDLRG